MRGQDEDVLVQCSVSLTSHHPFLHHCGLCIKKTWFVLQGGDTQQARLTYRGGTNPLPVRKFLGLYLLLKKETEGETMPWFYSSTL